VKVDIWSDIVCPWCAIGRARFVAALADFPHREEVRVRWHSFELDPEAPRERPGPLADHLAAKYGVSLDEAHGMHRRMTGVAADDGLDFRFERARSGNTFDAHRLLHHALRTGGPELQDRLKERFFRAYLTDGEPIGDPEALVRVAEEVGLDADGSRAVLAGDRYADAVRADELQARRYGITGVPFFVIDEKYGVSGAQPAEALRQVLDTAWAEANPLTLLTPSGARSDEGGACADGSCAI
jgi:predicted DsbA family dithiol-disulfide isomerase